MKRLLPLLFFRELPRTKSFSHFLSMAYSRTHQRSVASVAGSGFEPVDVKSLVWLNDNEPLIVVVDPSAKVNKQGLVAHLKANVASRVRLAPRNVAVELTGFAIGSIPPAFHTKPFKRTVVDEALIAKLRPSSNLQCSGHASGVLSLATLLDLPGVEVAPVSFEAYAAKLKGLVVGSDSALTSLQKLENAPGAALRDNTHDVKDPQPSVALPYFPADLPKVTGDANPPTALQTLSFVCQVVSVRRMARTLAFVSVDPVMGGSTSSIEEESSSGGLQTKEEKRSAALTWRCVSDGLPMAVQLIIGRTYMESLGETIGVPKLRTVKEGQALLVHGTVGKNAEWGAANWRSHRSCDVVVSGFEVLPDSMSDLGDTAVPTDSVTLPVDISGISNSTGDSNSASATDDKIQPGVPRSVPSLRLDDIIPSSPQLIDDAAGVETLARAIAEIVAAVSSTASNVICASKGSDENNATLPESVGGCWGFDAEWQPTRRLPVQPNQDPGGSTWEAPVALLQLATAHECFLLDLQTLRCGDNDAGVGQSPVEAKLDEALGALLNNPSILKVGFGGATDLRKLAASFPNMACFRAPRSILDLATWATACKAWELSAPDPNVELQSDTNRARKKSSRRRGQSRSLAGLVRALLGRELDKTEQCSAWIQRPLTDAQRHYAALDAAVVVKLASELAKISDPSLTQEGNLESSSSSDGIGLGSKSATKATAAANSLSFKRYVAHFQFMTVDDEESARRVKAKALYLGRGLGANHCNRDGFEGSSITREYSKDETQTTFGDTGSSSPMASMSEIPEKKGDEGINAGAEVRVEAVWIAAQSWPAYGAGPSKAPPRPPSPPSRTSEVGTYVDKSGVLRLAAGDLYTAEAVALALDDAKSTAAHASDATAQDSVRTGASENCATPLPASTPVEKSSSDSKNNKLASKHTEDYLKLGWPVGASKDRVMEVLVPPYVQAAPLPPPLDGNIGTKEAPADSGSIQSPERVRVAFNPRSGLVECGDAVVLFVNAIEAGGGAGSKYSNEWAHDGRQLSFFLRTHQWRGGSTPLAKRLLSAGRGRSSKEKATRKGESTESGAVLHDYSQYGATIDTEDRTNGAGSVLLFARSNSGPNRKSAPFVFCGRCTVTEAHSSLTTDISKGGGSRDEGPSGDLVELHLELLDFALANQAPPFQQLVAGTEVATMTTTRNNVRGPNAEHGYSSSSSGGGGEGLDDDALAQVALAKQVLRGDVIGACQIALNQAQTRPERRSLEAGVAALKVALARGGENAEVEAAVDALEAAASKLGLL